MAKTARIEFRLSPELKAKAEKVAKERNVTVSEMLTDYIKRLPSPKG
jgi:antitoxin component of RelBE/YafQ-DinJ toxin-antitoxin module